MIVFIHTCIYCMHASTLGGNDGNDTQLRVFAWDSCGKRGLFSVEAPGNSTDN